MMKIHNLSKTNSNYIYKHVVSSLPSPLPPPPPPPHVMGIGRVDS
jgi:hypothetical protein